MNDRIQELATQAFFETEYDDAQNLPETMERFAELIVQECVRYFNEEYQRDFDTLWREDLTEKIQQHFGVKE